MSGNDDVFSHQQPNNNEDEEVMVPRASCWRRRRGTALISVFVAVVVLLAVLIPAYVAPRGNKDDDSPSGQTSLEDQGGEPRPPGTPATASNATEAPSPAPSNLRTKSPVTEVPSGQPTAHFYESDVSAMLALIDEFESEEFYMINLVQYRDQAVYEDGRSTNLTGIEANTIYGTYMFNEMLPSIGAEVVYSAAVERDVINNSTKWDSSAVVKYPNGTAFRQMITTPKFQEMLAHKNAALQDTLVLGTRLVIAPNFPPENNPPFPPTTSDLPFAFMHIFDFKENAVYAEGDENADNSRTGEQAVGLYSANAGPVAFPLGIRMLVEFEVKAVLSGATTGWEKVRINSFPSHATFSTLTSNPVWQTGVHHRRAGLEKTSGLMTSPIMINKFAFS